MSWATAQRMKNSPQPVPDTPQRPSAQVPAPTSGVSPTRPQRLLVIPPVEVAVAMWPRTSSATAPTVPKYRPLRSSAASASMRSRARACSSSRRRRPVSKYALGTRSMSARVSAKASAPAPTSITCGECSITARASDTGLRIVVTPAIAPARRVWPSITEASSSCRPSASYTEPCPALKRGQSSSARTAASTASSAPPPRDSTAWPASSAASSPARMSRSSSAPSRSRSITPAPPWMTRAVGLVSVVSIATGYGILVIGDWWMVIGDWKGQEPKPPLFRITNHQSPITYHQSPITIHQSLLPQRLDRIQLRRLARGVVAEEQAGDDRKGRRQAHDLAVQGHRQVAEPAHQQGAGDADRDPDHAADQRDQHRLGQELPAHVRRPRAHRHAQADLADALGDRHQHD